MLCRLRADKKGKRDRRAFSFSPFFSLSLFGLGILFSRALSLTKALRKLNRLSGSLLSYRVMYEYSAYEYVRTSCFLQKLSPLLLLSSSFYIYLDSNYTILSGCVHEHGQERKENTLLLLLLLWLLLYVYCLSYMCSYSTVK